MKDKMERYTVTIEQVVTLMLRVKKKEKKFFTCTFKGYDI